MKKKVLGYILAGVMAVLFMPSAVSAAETQQGNAAAAVWDGSVDITWFTEQPWGTEEEPADYYIETPAQLAGLAYIVNGRLDTEQFPIKYKAGTKEKTDENVDVTATVDAVIDGAEGNRTTTSGLKAEDFWNNEITHIKTEGGGSGTTDYDLYVGNQRYDFAGKTLHIVNDLDLGGRYEDGQASGPNWMPIGGRFPADIDTLKIIVDANFNGSIDGMFHTIDNMYCERWSSKSYMWSQGVGLIGSLGSLYDSKDYEYGHNTEKESSLKEEVLKGWTSTVRNLCLGSGPEENSFRGYLHANRMVGALVGRAGDAVIENCANYTNVLVTDHKGAGGIVGATSGKGMIRNCYNAGNILGEATSRELGGIAGSNTFSICNCYNRGDIQSDYDDKVSEGIGSHYSGSPTDYIIDNCYSLAGSYGDTGREGIVTKNGYYYDTATDLVINTEVRNEHSNGGEGEGAGLKDPKFLSEINAHAGDVFVTDNSGINNGFPILFWQAAGFDANKTCRVAAGAGSSRGSIEICVPAGGYLEKTVIEKEQAVDVPVGTVVQLNSVAEAPNVLKNFTAQIGEGEAEKLRASFYTAIETNKNVVLDGNYIKLNSGTVSIKQKPQYEISYEKNSEGKTVTVISESQRKKQGDLYTIGVSKNGYVLDGNGKAWAVKDYTVKDGETVFQNDILTVKAVLKKGTVCEEDGKEYSGGFNYFYDYGNENDPEHNTSGLQTVTEDVGTEEVNGSLTISATPQTQEKTWATYADTSWVEDPDDVRGSFVISTPQQLAGLAQLVNSGVDFSKATIKLEKNISLKNPDEDGSVRTWKPIGQSFSARFTGIFDGQEHTISGITVSKPGDSIGGLFGYCENAKIQNLTVSGNITSSGYAAGIAAVMSGGTIENCVNKAAVTSTGERSGGIVSHMENEATLQGCINLGNVTGTSKTGGIAGEALDTAKNVSRCANYGEVQSNGSNGINSCTGGLVGYLGCVVERSANFGNVTASNACVGGIAGFTYANTKASSSKIEYNNSSAVYNSFNKAKVESTNTTPRTFVGGLVGRSDYLLMKNCYSTGTVATGDKNKTYLGTVVGGFYQSIFSNVSKVYYSNAGSPTTSYTKTGSIINVGKANPSLSYFSAQTKTFSDMAKPAFATLLNGESAGTFAAVTSDTPQLTWVIQKKTVQITYEGDYKRTEKTYYGGTVDLPECKEEGFKYTFKVDGKEWDGTYVTEDTVVTVGIEKIETAYVIFMADNQKVDVNGDGETDSRDWIRFYPEDGSGNKYCYLSDENIVKDATGITEIPDAETLVSKEGYTAEWDLTDSQGVSYWDEDRPNLLGVKNIRINAVYHQKLLPFSKQDNGEGTIRFAAEISDENDGYYFLAPQSKGTITVKSGAEVTLDGANGPFTNVRIVAEEGSGLVLKNMKIKTDPVRLNGSESSSGVLEIYGGADKNHATVIRYSGDCEITGTNSGGNGEDADGNRKIFPAVALHGYVTFDKANSSSDTIRITAGTESPEINIPTGATMDVAGGIIEVYKVQKLGANGGMIYGSSFNYETQRLKGDQKGDLTVSGGSLIAVSDSNNVFAACVNKYSQTGGQAIFYATEANLSRQGDEKYIGTDVALYADQIEVTGGSLSAKVRTHQNTTKDPIQYYSNAGAIASGDRGAGSFNGKYFLHVIDTSEWDQSSHTVKIDGNVFYTGKGNNVSHPLTAGDKFSRKKANADPYLYFWLSRGEKHTVQIDDGAEEAAAETDLEHTRFMTSIEGKTVKVVFLDDSLAAAGEEKKKTGVVAAAAAYDKDNQPIGFVSEHSFLLTEKEQQVILKSDAIEKADHIKLFFYDDEKTLRPLTPVIVLEK